MRFLIPFFFLLHLYCAQEIFRYAKNFKSLEESRNIYFEKKWFTQILDHFNPTDTRTWKQRYQINQEYYNSSQGGPIFLFIGGEGEMTSDMITKSAWVDYAKEFGALCFALEHRYYGQSHPTSDLSDKNMEYLTSQQAVADLAQFISEMKKEYKLSSKIKWIAFGCSYPGNLAAWLRLKYPHLVHAVVCSNSVISSVVDYKEYIQVVAEVFRNHSTQCINAIQKGFKQFDLTLRHVAKRKRLNKKFPLCEPIENSINRPKDISLLYYNLAFGFAGAAQFYKGNVFEDMNESKITVDKLCNIMENKRLRSPLDRLGRVNKFVVPLLGGKCIDYNYDRQTQLLMDVRWNTTNSNNGERQWIYQRCADMGLFPTSSHAPHIFSNAFPADYYIQQCMDVFGLQFNSTFVQSAVDRTNMFYGGFDIEVTKALFIFGSADPWHPLQIPKLENVIYINGSAHCADMFPKSKKDSHELKEARKKTVEYIKKWLEN